MLRSLVGSEMCIRDRCCSELERHYHEIVPILLRSEHILKRLPFLSQILCFTHLRSIFRRVCFSLLPLDPSPQHLSRSEGSIVLYEGHSAPEVGNSAHLLPAPYGRLEGPRVLCPSRTFSIPCDRLSVSAGSLIPSVMPQEVGCKGVVD